MTSERRPVVDAHCDVLLRLLSEKTTLAARQRGHITLDRLLASPVGLQFFDVFVEPEFGEDRGLRRALEMVGLFDEEMARHEDRLKPVRSVSDLAEDGRIGGLLALEGCDILGGDLGLIDVLGRLGVRSVMFTWNQRNRFADGTMDQASGGGLSSLGKQAAKRFQAAHILLDVSHLSVAGFWDLLKETEGPVIASHSNARAVLDHPRNLYDDQVRALADRGGVIGLNFSSGFLTERGQASLDDIFRHLDHVVSVGGEDAVGFGSDYDGIETPPKDLDDVSRFGLLLEEMKRRGYASGLIEKVAGDNFRRVLHAVLPKDEGGLA